MAVKIVAEIGCNHQGDMGLAKRLIEEAAKAGADYAKFQKRTITSEEYSNAPHPDQHNAFGSTYLEHRRALEFDLEQHKELKSHCERAGIGYACSVWDMRALEDIASLEPDYIKIPSAKNEDEDLIYYASKIDKSIHISLGMFDKRAKSSLLDFWLSNLDSPVLYHCTSAYPCKFENAWILDIDRLTDWIYRKNIGFSGHHLGIAIDMAAIALGATWLERHFTLDRTMKGTDHAASLEPGGLARLVRDAVAVQEAMQYRPGGIPKCEMPAYSKLKGGA